MPIWTPPELDAPVWPRVSGCPRHCGSTVGRSSHTWVSHPVTVTASDQRSFPDAQSARRHFMQLRSQLIREGQQPTKWLCNWANCQHDNPNDCGNPSLGGRWLFD